ncbi:hypothetical protein G7066_05640 [Leucobacter coleopterorum]|uniref:Uncharacterized protein n=1 Tax=Leucobacter coleopterorum TaxID=2714933 RepID=A0ABX6JXD8_9MICO|nr:hypothetical protein [Leucobacter coleopterorum]QIM18263.1 hypothetical protein G7066_05640 [Leucobacter coleopterorum]
MTLAFGAAVGIISFFVGGSLAGGYSSFTAASPNPLSPYDFSVLTVLSDAITAPITELGALGIAIASTLLYLDARGKAERLDLTIENWQNRVNQGVPAQHMAYPFATPVAAPPAYPAPPAPPTPPASPTQGWQQP